MKKTYADESLMIFRKKKLVMEHLKIFPTECQKEIESFFFLKKRPEEFLKIICKGLA